ncbi:MAG: N-acetylmuramidase family protein [Prevotellaceae bacterium]|jgi:hypothetical protein|nr:N-acetylmuramidase family protein [Prevotellaceae bacterium]
MQKIIDLIKHNAQTFKIEEASLYAFTATETGLKGFDEKTGKILIQFEPSWFKKKAPYAPSGKWSVNTVDVQSREWEAFNDAFAKNSNAAMESTSIGLGQVMGFNWKRIGYTSVGAMWDDAKKGLDRQMWQMCRYIETDIKLQSALKAKDWDTVATLYNGAGYRDLAKKYKREPYDITMKNHYEKYLKL